MITVKEENLLINQVLAGNEQAYAKLVDRYKSYAFTIALKITNNRADAEEVAQDAFIKAFHYLGGFKRGARFSTWLYRIVFNTAVSHKRKNKHIFHPIEDSFSERADEDKHMEKQDKHHYLEIALNKLNEADRLSIQLFYLKEFSLEEVSEMMGQKLNTTKVRIHRARQRLADELKLILQGEALSL